MTGRLEKRVRKLEGGTGVGVDIVAKVPWMWPKERQSAEVEAIASAHGITGPFGMVILLQDFSASEDDETQIISVGGSGMDVRLDEPLTLSNANEPSL